MVRPTPILFYMIILGGLGSSGVTVSTNSRSVGVCSLYLRFSV